MSDLFLKIVNMSLSGAVVILAVLCLRLLLRKAPKNWCYLLWSVVGFRLCCPVSLPAIFSLFRLVPVQASATLVTAPAPTSIIRYIPSDIGYTARPQVEQAVSGFSEAIDAAVPAVAPQTGMSPVQFWLLAATVIWVTGMTILLAVSLWNYFKTQHLVLDAVRVEKGVYETDAIDSPFILGFLRPLIYLPVGLEGERRRYVLEHERYHLKRKDYLIRLFAFLLLALHWFNPLVWLAYYLMGKDMEMSCDEKVLGMEENKQKEYCITLLSFAVAGRFPGLLAFGETSVSNRIRNALNWKRPRTWISILAAVACLTAILVCGSNPIEKSGTRSEDVSPNVTENDVSADKTAGEWSNVTELLNDLDPRQTKLTFYTENSDPVTVEAADALGWNKLLEELRRIKWEAFTPQPDGDDSTEQSECWIELTTGDYAVTFYLESVAKFTAPNGETTWYKAVQDWPYHPLETWWKEADVAETHRGRAGISLTPEEFHALQDFTSTLRIEYNPDGSYKYTTNTGISCFFTSRYADPRDMDAGNFLYYFPSEEAAQDRKDSNELAAIKAEWCRRYPEAPEMIDMLMQTGPCTRIPREKVDEVLTEYAGITVADMHTDWMTLKKCLYVPETDCFYSFASDFGPGWFTPLYGEKEDDIITLYGPSAYGGPDSMETDSAVLKLQKVGDGYHILSHLEEKM